MVSGTTTPGQSAPHKKSDGEVPVMLQHWGMQNIPLLPSLPGPFWLRVVAPDKGPI